MIRSKLFMSVVAAGVMIAGAAFAGKMDPTIGNTVIMTRADGSVYEFRHAADGTIACTWPDGSVQTGKWVEEGDKVTETSDLDGKAYVYDISGPERKVGESWDATDWEGQPAHFELKAGQ